MLLKSAYARALVKTPVPSVVVRNLSSKVRSTRNISPMASAASGPSSGAAPAAAKPVPDMYQESSDPEVQAFQAHQKTAARPSFAEEARTLVNLAKWGTLCTLSQRDDTKGFPLGSVVEYVDNGKGQPVFAVSTLSPHTRDLAEDGRVCLTVTSNNFSGLQDARFALQGSVRAVTDDEKAPLREAFLRKYPDAFWVDFGDFRWFVLDSIKSGRYVGGFGAVKTISAEEYSSARPDPVAMFSAPVCGHMNADHVGDTLAMVKHYVGITAEGAKILDLDRLGMNLSVTWKGQAVKLRLPFSKPAEDRKGIKEAIVEMTKAAAAASKA